MMITMQQLRNFESLETLNERRKEKLSYCLDWVFSFTREEHHLLTGRVTIYWTSRVRRDGQSASLQRF